MSLSEKRRRLLDDIDAKREVESGEEPRDDLTGCSLAPTVNGTSTKSIPNNPFLTNTTIAAFPSPEQQTMRLVSSNVYQGAARCSYAVRGNVVQRAMELEKQGHKIVYCNIGNPQSLGQKPITFLRQVLALVNYPELLNHPSPLFPKDAVERARRYIKALPGGSSGSYTHSAGIKEVRDDVSEFLARRDGTPCDPEDLFLTDGASPAAHMLLRVLVRDGKDGVLVPTPRYPLYSALLDLVGGERVDYFLDEARGWQLSREELERAYTEGKKRGVELRALVVVNPGNPTGQVMDRASLEDTVDFCRSRNLVLIADEVYQENIWRRDAQFVSFKRVAAEMGALNRVQLASLHSVSKGFFGECGRRGGFVEMSGFSREVKDIMYKMASVNLCSNVEGQLTVGVMCRAPKSGDDSYQSFCKERDSTLEGLRRRAGIVGKLLNDGDSLTCQLPEGALYAFPKVVLPRKFVEKFRTNPDEAYCLLLLDATGIVLVPGSGFGQREGSFHFRTTILPPERDLPLILDEIVQFHRNLVREYS